MKKLSKLFLAMILAFTSIVVFNPNETKVQEASTYAMATEITLNNKVVYLPVQYSGYNLNYHKIYVTGSYMLNKSGTRYYLTSVDLTYSKSTSITFNSDKTSSGSYEVVDFDVESKEASSTCKLILNYRLEYKRRSGVSLGYYYGSVTVQ